MAKTTSSTWRGASNPRTHERITHDVIARFEVERQSLAMMNHPNIAKVLGAGTTDSGNPYFVMELVHGVPITEYADRHHMTVPQRLQLFIAVCGAA